MREEVRGGKFSAPAEKVSAMLQRELRYTRAV